MRVKFSILLTFGGAVMQCYLFVHFREKTTPDGEQVFFALSRDGFHWEKVNDGRPVLWAFYGDRGVRDHTIIRAEDGAFHIFSTDLSLAYGMRGKYGNNWANIGRHGSKALSHWRSEDLIHWTEQALIPLGDDSFGCLWAPDILRDSATGEYVLHFSSTRAETGFAWHSIHAVRTRDFEHFSAPYELYRKEDCPVIDSAIYEEDGRYYLFLKSTANPENIILLQAPSLEGPWERVERFDERMQVLDSGMYEGATAVRLEDGRWCLFVDYYGVPGDGQGYVPFVAPSLASGDFVRADEAFSFPYGFKHGTILTITEEEYQRIRGHRWPW